VARLWLVVRPFAAEHTGAIAGVWAYLIAGGVLASWVLWDAHQRGSHHTRSWAWATQFFPPMILLYLVLRYEERPLTTAFGEARYTTPQGDLLPSGTRPPLVSPQGRPPHLWLVLVLTALLPGLGQVALGRWKRAIVLWCLMAFSASFVVLYLLGIRGAWSVSEALVPRTTGATTVTLHFEVPAYLFWLMLGELAAVFLWAYADCIAIADEKIHLLPHRKEPPQALFNVRVYRPAGEPETVRVEKPSILVGSDAGCDVVVEGAARRHLSIYLQHLHHVPHHLFEQVHHDVIHARHCDAGATFRLNGADVQEGDLEPGSVIEVGGERLEFAPLVDPE
jgi:hypothetical protein